MQPHAGARVLFIYHNVQGMIQPSRKFSKPIEPESRRHASTPTPTGRHDGSVLLTWMLPGGGIVTEICGALTVGGGTGTCTMPPPPGNSVGNCMGPEDGMKGVEPSEAGPGMGMLVPREFAGPCLGDGAGSGLDIGIGR